MHQTQTDGVLAASDTRQGGAFTASPSSLTKVVSARLSGRTAIVTTAHVTALL